ncbi:hypothetical protein GWK47_033410 [Chionoecetes opilio]|uniref:Uncharacterized protein n=1 Tax=Chionoecetes opilio TaxID=41210 RepID=A0A8J4YJ44_CHIOP|nr:hypothetical protein GWK47_033410 [Chionoecetes opilio]
MYTAGKDLSAPHRENSEAPFCPATQTPPPPPHLWPNPRFLLSRSREATAATSDKANRDFRDVVLPPPPAPDGDDDEELYDEIPGIASLSRPPPMTNKPNFPPPPSATSKPKTPFMKKGPPPPAKWKPNMY